MKGFKISFMGKSDTQKSARVLSAAIQGRAKWSMSGD